MLSLLVASLSVVVAALPAQKAAPKAPERVHIIGASVSGGFEDGPMTGAEVAGDSCSLHHVLKRWADGEVRVTTHPTLEMCMLFMDPVTRGKKMIERAQKKDADLIVAVDFPFWFAYGYVNGDELEQRSARFEKGLAFLAEFDVPVLVGDLPDMRGASTRLLSPRQVPSKDVLGKLNERLKQWAGEHPNVTLVPLAETVQQLKDDGVTLPLEGGAKKTPPGALLQGDRLHATRLGVAFLVHRLQEPLRAAFPKGHALHEQQWTFEQFVEAAGAEVTLEDVLAKAEANAKNEDAKAGK